MFSCGETLGGSCGTQSNGSLTLVALGCDPLVLLPAMSGGRASDPLRTEKLHVRKGLAVQERQDSGICGMKASSYQHFPLYSVLVVYFGITLCALKKNP